MKSRSQNKNATILTCILCLSHTLKRLLWNRSGGPGDFFFKLKIYLFLSVCEGTLRCVSVSRGHRCPLTPDSVFQSPALWRQGLSLKVEFPLSHPGQELAGSSDLSISTCLLHVNCFCECWDSNSGPHSRRTSSC